MKRGKGAKRPKGATTLDSNIFFLSKHTKNEISYRPKGENEVKSDQKESPDLREEKERSDRREPQHWIVISFSYVWRDY